MLDTSAPLVLIDTGYASIFRFYAVQKYFRLTYKSSSFSDPEYDWSQNQLFLDKYAEMFTKSLDKIVKVFRVPFKNIVLAEDDLRDNIWRLNILDSYKKVKPRKRQIGLGKILQNLRERLIPDLHERKGLHAIGISHLEADDIIAIITKYAVVKKLFPKVVIVTNDKDFLQLRHRDVVIVNLQGNYLFPKNDLNPQKDLLNHILLGDRSDNISTCIPRRDLHLIDRYIHDVSFLHHKLKNKKFKKLFQRNRTLIDFASIPLPYQKKIMTAFQILMKKP